MRQKEAHSQAREDAQNDNLACARGCVFSYGGWSKSPCLACVACSQLAIHGPRHLTTAWRLPVAHELAGSLLSVFKRSPWLWISQLHKMKKNLFGGLRISGQCLPANTPSVCLPAANTTRVLPPQTGVPLTEPEGSRQQRQMHQHQEAHQRTVQRQLPQAAASSMQQPPLPAMRSPPQAPRTASPQSAATWRRAAAPQWAGRVAQPARRSRATQTRVLRAQPSGARADRRSLRLLWTEAARLAAGARPAQGRRREA